jgi:cell division protein FtsN
LQAGSFKNFDQADRRKASLALLGASANIQRVTLHDNEVWYRVRIGPFNDLKKLDNIRVLLYKNNINAIPLKVKPKKNNG